MRFLIEAAFLSDELGQSRTAATWLKHVEASVGDEVSVLSELGWALAELGDEEGAARIALRGIDREDLPPALAWLWRVLHVRYTRTLIPRETLQGWAGKARPLEILLSRAVAARKAIDLADGLLAQMGPPPLVRRMQADVRLESKDEADWRDAASRYTEIEKDPELPSLQRADVIFNRGVIHERLDEQEQAIECYQQALELNELLEPAAERLLALGAELSLPDSQGASKGS